MGDPAKCSWYVVVKNGVPMPDAKSSGGKLFDADTEDSIQRRDFASLRRTPKVELMAAKW